MIRIHRCLALFNNNTNKNKFKLLFDNYKHANKSLFIRINNNTYQTKKIKYDDNDAIDNKSSKKSNGKEAAKTLNELFQAIDIKPNIGKKCALGEEIGGKIKKDDLQKVLMEFFRKDEAKAMATEVGLTHDMFQQAFKSFRRYCIQSVSLPVDFHVKLSDIVTNKAPITDIFPYFLKHTRDMFPHLVCMEELKQISNLTEPAEWYADARKIQRKIIYHAGPTNSGKTYTALEEFKKSASGIYCGPLKLLANEIAQKTNDHSPICDMITGDERRYIKENGEPSTHVSCTVEMSDINREFDVAIIDEIQMISDSQRGWAWTRAFLGLRAKEIHLCGDRSAADLIEDLCFITNDEFELREYKRLSKLTICDFPLNSLKNVRPGDCIVCFSKHSIFQIVRQLEKLGHKVAVIYGSMPPGAKLTQTKRFNDPSDPCKILVATDAIGMGLNLNIRRIIFNSITKNSLIEDDNAEGYITTSQALQIAGRAGRFNSEFPDGEVTTLRQEDLPVLREILSKPIDTIAKAGLHPTADQIELFAYQLPNHSLSRLIEIFENICQVDNSKYFLCQLDAVKYIADLIEHVELPLKARYVFALAPISTKDTFVGTCLVKFARSYSRGEPITVSDVDKMVEWPCKLPTTANDLAYLESVFDVFDVYLWLSYRFSDMFPDVTEIRTKRVKLDNMILVGISRILKNQKFQNVTNSKDGTKSTQKDDKQSKSVSENAKKVGLNKEGKRVNSILEKLASFPVSEQQNDNSKFKQKQPIGKKSASSNNNSLNNLEKVEEIENEDNEIENGSIEDEEKISEVANYKKSLNSKVQSGGPQDATHNKSKELVYDIKKRNGTQKNKGNDEVKQSKNSKPASENIDNNEEPSANNSNTDKILKELISKGYIKQKTLERLNINKKK